MNSSDTGRHPVPRRRAHAAAAFGILLLSGFDARAQDSAASLSGSLVGPEASVIPNVVLYLTHTQTLVQRKATTDILGRYEFLSLPPGPYRVTSGSSGIGGFQVVLAPGERHERDISVTINPVGMGIIVWSAAGPSDAGAVMAGSPPNNVRLSAEEREDFDTWRRAQPVQAPIAVHMATPLYPESMIRTEREGSVTLSAVIGSDGFLKGVRMDVPADERQRRGSSQAPAVAAETEFRRAVEAAAVGWQWEPGRINGTIVEVPLEVQISFRLGAPAGRGPDLLLR